MKKLILFLLFVPLVSFGQIITNNKLNERVDVRDYEAIQVGLAGKLIQKSWISFKDKWGSSKAKIKLDRFSEIYVNGQVVKNGRSVAVGQNAREFWRQYLSDYGFRETAFDKSGGDVSIYQSRRDGRISSTVTPENNYMYFRREIQSELINQTNVTVGQNASQIKKDNAINKLKEAKELFELEIITKEEYEEIKKELKKNIIAEFTNNPNEINKKNIEKSYSTILEGTKIIISMIKSISTNKTKRTRDGDKPKKVLFGQNIDLEVMEDFLDEDGNVLIKKGTPVIGIITSAKKAKIAENRGELKFKVDEIKAVDGTSIRVKLNFTYKPKRTTGRIAVTVAVAVLAAPVAILRRGKPATIEAGTTFSAIVIKSTEIAYN